MANIDLGLQINLLIYDEKGLDLQDMTLTFSNAGEEQLTVDAYGYVEDEGSRRTYYNVTLEYDKYGDLEITNVVEYSAEEYKAM